MRFKQLTREDLTRALGRPTRYWHDDHMQLPSAKELEALLHKWQGLLPKVRNLRVGLGPLGFGTRITGVWRG